MNQEAICCNVTLNLFQGLLSTRSRNKFGMTIQIGMTIWFGMTMCIYLFKMSTVWLDAPISSGRSAFAS